MNAITLIAPDELCSSTARVWKEAVTKEIPLLDGEVVIDLIKTRFVDSSGLGVLLSLNKLMSNHGGKLKLLNPSASVSQLIELTRLHRVFEIIHA